MKIKFNVDFDNNYSYNEKSYLKTHKSKPQKESRSEKYEPGDKRNNKRDKKDYSQQRNMKRGEHQ